MSSFHFCLSAARNLSSFQLLPTSLMTDLLQLFLGLPLFLLPWGFHSRAAFGISPSSFLSVWPIHRSFLFLISKFISSWPVTLHKSSLEMMFGHHILKIICLIKGAFVGKKEVWCYQDAQYNDKKNYRDIMFTWRGYAGKVKVKWRNLSLLMILKYPACFQK